MTDPANAKDGDDDLDLDLELEPADSDASAPAAVESPAATPVADEAVELEPAEAAAAAAAGAADPTTGRWVWQFGAPPPPPSFGARFFGGGALGELYRFFFCGVMVMIGALLPWGVEVDVPAGLESALTEQAATEGAEALDPATDVVIESVHAHVPGYELVAGALALLLGLYLMYGSAVGIYSGRQRILPIALMIIPAEASWKRFIDAWGSLEGGFLDKFTEVFAVTGTGVMLTLLGSTIVVVQFLATIGKVMQKTPEEKEKAAKRAASKGSKGKAKKDKGDKDGDDDKAKAKGGRKRRR